MVLSRSANFKAYTEAYFAELKSKLVEALVPTTKSIDITTGTVEPTFGPIASDSKDLYSRDRLMWCLSNLFHDKDSPYCLGLKTVLQVLDDHLKTSSRKELARLDGEIYHRISDMVACVRILDMLDMHRPMLGPAHLKMLNQDRPVWQYWKDFAAPGTKTLGALDTALGDTLIPLNRFNLKGRKDKD